MLAIAVEPGKPPHMTLCSSNWHLEFFTKTAPWLINKLRQERQKRIEELAGAPCGDPVIDKCFEDEARAFVELEEE